MDDGRLFDPTPTLTVSEVNRRISVVLDRAFGEEVWVQGEISGLSADRRAGTHLFFDLVDPTGDRGPAKLRVALFAENRRGVNALLKRSGGVRMEDGLDVRIRGSIGFFRKQGTVQLKMTAIDPEHTLGALAAGRDRVLAQLRAEGLTERNGRLPLSEIPLRIGLVTSAGSAACQDFLHELEAGGLRWQVRLVDTRVQGREAERSLVPALEAAAAGVDVVAVVRGGGARSDLATFDRESIARAIASMPVPVLTGLGHESDRSIADEVAHSAHKTPTAAAAFLVGRARAWVERGESAWSGIAREARRHGAEADRRLVDRAATARRRVVASLDRADGRLTAFGAIAAAGSNRAVERAGARCEGHVDRLARAAPRPLDGAERTLDAHARTLAALDPQRVLARGFSITRTDDGRVVRDPAQAGPGRRLHTTVAAGELVSRVEETDHDRT